ncbi:MAG TPA: DUF3311 domain-containing protein [Bacillales bacterium]
MSRQAFQWLFVILMILCLLPLIFPIYEVANQGTPIIVGLPFGFFWVILWIVIAFVIAVILYLVDPDNKNREE